MLTRKEFLKVSLASLVGLAGLKNVSLSDEEIVEEVSIPVENNIPVSNDGKWHAYIRTPEGLLIDLEATSIEFSSNNHLKDYFVDGHASPPITISEYTSFEIRVIGTNGVITQEMFDEL